ncbi:MAG: hypothetical protein GX900_03145 [Clostridiaceae bacterium]|nr:hypothetical protein [Clostridiaceae bacterium]
MARYTHKVDEKGRLFLPARLRPQIGNEVVVTVSLQEGYLSIYTVPAYEAVKRQIESLPGTDPRVRRMRLEIIGEATFCPLDSQGRISISRELWDLIEVSPGEEVSLSDLDDTMLLCSLKSHLERRATQVPLGDLDLSTYEITGIV